MNVCFMPFNKNFRNQRKFAFFSSILIFVYKPKASVKLSNGISGVKTMCNDESKSSFMGLNDCRPF